MSLAQPSVDVNTPLAESERLVSQYVQSGYGTIKAITPTVTECLSQHGSSGSESEDDQTRNEPERPPGRRKFLGGVSNTRFWLIFGCILWNEFIATFDSTLMASVHPVITSYFNSSNSASWLSTAFIISATAPMPLFAPLSDTIGRRSVWLGTTFIFAIALIWCALAPGVGSFIAARALCGLGAGGIMAMGPIITNDLVPIEMRATVQSMLILAFGLGQASGAAFGGFLCDFIGWRGAFWVQIPGFVFCGVLSYLTVPNNLGPQLAKNSKNAVKALVKTFDIAGLLLLACSVTCLILYLNLGGVILSWSHPALIATLIVSVVSACLFLRIETRAAYPVMPMRLLVSRPRANINFANFFGSLVMAATTFNAPLYFEVVKDDSPTVAGLRLIAPSLALCASGFLSCLIITSKYRIRPAIVFGAIIMLLGSICISRLSRMIPGWLGLIFLIPSFLGQGFMFPATYLCMLRVSPVQEHAVTTSTVMLWRQLGSIMGIAVSTLVVQNRLSFHLWQTVTGAHKAEIIHKIQKSVRAIQELSPLHKEQAVSAYSSALSTTFAVNIIFTIIMLAVALPIKLPKEKEPKQEPPEAAEEVGEGQQAAAA